MFFETQRDLWFGSSKTHKKAGAVSHRNPQSRCILHRFYVFPDIYVGELLVYIIRALCERPTGSLLFYDF